MSDATASELSTEDESILRFERKQRDYARLNKVAIRHAAIFLSALTLWGAADYWAAGSGWTLAGIVALLNAVFAGTVMAYLAHEWGHFSGARLSGAVSPVMKEPVSFFMFSFKDDLNSSGQFISMSLGGPIANWTLAALVFFAVPGDTWSQDMLLATTVAIAVSVSVFEFPIINRVMYGDNPTEAVKTRQKESGTMPRKIGIAVGAIVWLIAI